MKAREITGLWCVLVLASATAACSSDETGEYRTVAGSGGSYYVGPVAGYGGSTAGSGGQGQSLCGNGVIDRSAGEQCDGTQLDGESCASLGHAGGALACYPTSCTYDVRMCIEMDSGYGAGGGGSGGSSGTGGSGDDAGNDEDAGN
jgi:hypothetical protein